MEIRAQNLAPPALPQCIGSALCGEFLKGFCRNGDACAQSHAIYRVYDEAQHSGTSARIVSFPNALYLTPRVSPQDDSIFDHDGPGHLSVDGPRHDNDHADIGNIRILPTTDEILSRRSPYMPYKDFHLPHFLEAGQPRLLDTLFRQLRYDSTEAIIDACYHACQKLVISLATQGAMSDVYQVRQDTPNGHRYSLFWDVGFEELIFDDQKGIIVRVSFACPTFLRGRRMHSSGFFDDGMLVALVGLDNIDSGLSVTFFETHLRESTDAMQSRDGKGIRGKPKRSCARSVRSNNSQPLSNCLSHDVKVKKIYVESCITRRAFSAADSCLLSFQTPYCQGSRGVSNVSKNYIINMTLRSGSR